MPQAAPTIAEHGRANTVAGDEMSEEESPVLDKHQPPGTSAAATAEPPAQISKEDRIAAAREKYLARKRQRTG